MYAKAKATEEQKKNSRNDTNEQRDIRSEPSWREIEQQRKEYEDYGWHYDKEKRI